MLSIIDRMDLKSRLRPLRDGDMYEINGKNYYSEELLFDRLSENEEMDSAAIADLIDERDEARELAEQFRDLLQANGVLFADHRLPWENDL